MFYTISSVFEAEIIRLLLKVIPNTFFPIPQTYFCVWPHICRCLQCIFSAIIFICHLMPRPGIELMSVQLHLLEGPLFRALNKLSYHGLCKDSNNSVLEPRMHFLNVPHLLVRVFSKESLKIFKTEIFWH